MKIQDFILNTICRTRRQSFVSFAKPVEIQIKRFDSQAIFWHGLAFLQMYTKAGEMESLASFYEACAQIEIGEFRDYEKVLNGHKFNQWWISFLTIKVVYIYTYFLLISSSLPINHCHFRTLPGAVPSYLIFSPDGPGTFSWTHNRVPTSQTFSWLK